MSTAFNDSSPAIDGENQTAGQLVFRNLLREILPFLQKPSDRLNRALTCKFGFTIATPGLYRVSHSKRFDLLWASGCDLTRFGIYASSVRDLGLPSYDRRWPIGLDIQRWLRQHPNVQYLCHPKRSGRPGEFWVVEMIRAGKATLEVQGWRQTSVLAGKSAFEPVGEQDCRSLGILDVDGDEMPASDQDTVFNIILQKTALPGPSVWTTLRGLLLPEVEITLPNLEALMLGCPKLSDLSCKFTCPSSDAFAYMTRLSHLLDGRPIELDCETAGAGLLVFARHLAVCTSFRVKGPLLWQIALGMIGPGWSFPEPTPFESAKVTHVYLQPIVAKGRICDAQEIAQTIRKIFPPTSVIAIVIGILPLHRIHENNDLTFLETLRSALKSLQQEAIQRDAKLRTPGWSKRE